MAASVYKSALAGGGGSPKDKDKSFAVERKSDNCLVGQFFPASLLVAAGTVGNDSKRRVEQKYPLPGPACQISVGGNRSSGVVVNLFEYVY